MENVPVYVTITLQANRNQVLMAAKPRHWLEVVEEGETIRGLAVEPEQAEALLQALGFGLEPLVSEFKGLELVRYYGPAM